MNQSELIAAAAKEAGVSQAEAGRVLDAFLSTIQATLVKGEDVRLSGLGIFDVADRAAREGRNPATGETIKIAATKAVRFRPSKTLKDAVAKK
ncbi:HU family DNA-binding protein [Caulobacter sp. 73W]|uniref:HU family DNA-binding protein n=1 Tax=Caulobacter sp. 73W TaxID=3161137 RepID=A0AB39KNN7_9CAUL|nr:HU family DNA-binding protein [Caulobacter segnis]MDG2521523.1 HU family DNA-binding protein [Caulobacter segnis]